MSEKSGKDFPRIRFSYPGFKKVVTKDSCYVNMMQKWCENPDKKVCPFREDDTKRSFCGALCGVIWPALFIGFIMKNSLAMCPCSVMDTERIVKTIKKAIDKWRKK